MAVAASPVSAQMGGGGRHHRNGGDQQASKPRVDEQAYQAALRKIPDKKGANDPWAGARAVDPAASKAK